MYACVGALLHMSCVAAYIVPCCVCRVYVGVGTYVMS